MTQPGKKLTELRIDDDISATLHKADAVVLEVKHDAYLRLTPDRVVEMTGRLVAVVDCSGILDDAKISRFFEFGCEVKGLGRRHMKKIKDEVQGKKLKEEGEGECVGILYNFIIVRVMGWR